MSESISTELMAVHARFQHLDGVFRSVSNDEGAFHQTARDLWLAVCEAVERDAATEPVGLGNGWLMIDSAPKSGKPALLWWRRCTHPAVGRWVDDEAGVGWVCDGDQCMPANQDDCTHWMPLPPSGPRVIDATCKDGLQVQGEEANTKVTGVSPVG